MVIVRIYGGLGNQLFQYALGRQLALLSKRRLMLHVAAGNPTELGRCDLDLLATVGERVPAGGAPLLSLASKAVRIAEGRGRLPTSLRRFHRVYWERPGGYDPSILQIRHGAYLIGHWQSESYFVDIAETLRRELVVSAPPDAENQRLLDEIMSFPSVCVHVRRGDYVTHLATSAAYGVCEPEYYEACRARLLAIRPDARFFVFSDDPVWTREAFRHWSATTFVDHNSVERRVEDFRLMTSCRYFVTANSTFSWWPAWLSNHPDKVVFAPERYFAQPSATSPDLVPKNWIRV